jgi:hypothetical protein
MSRKDLTSTNVHILTPEEPSSSRSSVHSPAEMSSKDLTSTNVHILTPEEPSSSRASVYSPAEMSSKDPTMLKAGELKASMLTYADVC